MNLPFAWLFPRSGCEYAGGAYAGGGPFNAGATGTFDDAGA